MSNSSSRTIKIIVGADSYVPTEHFVNTNATIKQIKAAYKKAEQELGYDIMESCDLKKELSKPELDALLKLGYRLPDSISKDMTTWDWRFVFDPCIEITNKSIYLDMFLFLVKHADTSITFEFAHNKIEELEIGGNAFFEES